MPESTDSKKGKFMVVVDDTASEVFDNMEDAREYIQDEVDDDSQEDARLYRVTDVYTVVGATKKVLFHKETE